MCKKTLSFLLSLATITIVTSAEAYYFWDQGFAQATVNTSYTERYKGTITNPITYSGCPWPDPVMGCANAMNNIPMPTYWTAGGGQDLSWSQNGPFGANRYWVLDINNEDYARACNWGPPDLSTKRSEPGSGLYGFAAITDPPLGESFYRAHLVMNMWSHLPERDPCGAGSSTPYMAIAASDVRGNGGLVGMINPYPTYSAPSFVHFTAKLWDFAPTDGGGAWFGAAAFRLVLVAQWLDNQGRDIQRQIHINLFHHVIEDGFQGPWRWNWPIQEAMHFPGAEVSFADVEDLNANCASYGIYLHRMTTADIGRDISYRINASKIFQCFSDNNKFGNPMPANNVMFRGVHWALEGAGKDGGLWVSVHNMRMDTN